VSNDIEQVIIVGSGPAAHTAAVYAARAELNPLLFEGFMAGGVAAGGQLTTTTEVENFPGFPEGIMGPALMDDMRKQSVRLGTRIKTETVDAIDMSSRPFIVKVGSKEYAARSVIIATGATAQRLGLPGEDQYWQRGMSACAVCDGALPIFRDKPLIVIGGGDSACEEASYLSKFGSKITMLVRRDELRASKAMQKRVFDNEKITIMWNTNATEVLGDGKLLSQVKVLNNKSGEEQVLDAGAFSTRSGTNRIRNSSRDSSRRMRRDTSSPTENRPRPTFRGYSPPGTYRTRSTARRLPLPVRGVWPPSRRRSFSSNRKGRTEPTPGTGFRRILCRSRESALVPGAGLHRYRFGSSSMTAAVSSM
jgi:thioredoxin reductase (NADPH)